MTVLIAGGSKGSQVIRGQQLGAAVGATVQARPGRSWGSPDVVVLLKRAAQELAVSARASGARLVWDVLDYWEQPLDNALSIAEHVRRVQAIRESVGVSMLIATTKLMADDVGGVYLPHHSRPGLVPTPIREKARVVAYEGTPKYLGLWRKELEYACARMGLTLAINPRSLADADVVVAFRGGQWDGEACHRWKSGVKYVNAIAAGRPVVTQRCAAFDEIDPFGMAIDRPDQLMQALRSLLPARTRQQCYEVSLTRAKAFSLETIAATYRGILTRAVEQVAA